MLCKPADLSARILAVKDTLGARACDEFFSLFQNCLSFGLCGRGAHVLHERLDCSLGFSVPLTTLDVLSVALNSRFMICHNSNNLCVKIPFSYEPVL